MEDFQSLLFIQYPSNPEQPTASGSLADDIQSLFSEQSPPVFTGGGHEGKISKSSLALLLFAATSTKEFFLSRLMPLKPIDMVALTFWDFDRLQNASIVPAPGSRFQIFSPMTFSVFFTT